MVSFVFIIGASSSSTCRNLQDNQLERFLLMGYKTELRCRHKATTSPSKPQQNSHSWLTTNFQKVSDITRILITVLKAISKLATAVVVTMEVTQQLSRLAAEVGSNGPNDGLRMVSTARMERGENSFRTLSKALSDSTKTTKRRHKT